MKTTQSNSLESFVAAQGPLNEMKTVSTNPALAAKVDELGIMLGRLRKLVAAQAESVRGKIVNREAVLVTFEAATLAVAGAVLSYATDKKLGELATKVDLSRSDLVKTRYSERPGLAQRVHDAAATVVADLAHYEVTPQTLIDFQAVIDEAATAVAEPRNTVVAKKVATAELATGIKEVRDFFALHLDPLMNKVRAKGPSIYARYREARVVIDRPATHATAETEPTTPAPVTTPTTPAQ